MSRQRRRGTAAAAEFYVYVQGVAVPRDVTRVHVHPSVRVLEDRAFYDCRCLREVVLPEGLLEVGRRTFHHCKLLQLINLPSTLIKIGEYAFCRCASLRELSFPEGLASIGGNAFHWCSALVCLRLPSTVAIIAAGAFAHCRSLEVVTLVEGTREIGDKAFLGCRSLIGVLLPATLTTIGKNSFVFCPLLKRLKLCGGILRIEAQAFDASISLEYFKIPSRALVAVAETREIPNCHLVTDGAIPRTNLSQVVITSECLYSASAGEISDVELAITNILGPELGLGWDRASERLLALFAPYELRHKKEVATILKLGLWKAKGGASDRANPEVRQGCRLKCGASVVIPNVLTFL